MSDPMSDPISDSEVTCADVRRHLLDVIEGEGFDAESRGSHQPIPTGIHRHSKDCSSCSQLAAATRWQIRVLQELPRPSLPVALQDPALLSAIAERAAAGAEQHLSPLLKEHLSPLEAPMDATWVEGSPLRVLHGSDDLAIGLKTLAEPRRSPSRLWLRVRGEIETLRNVRRIDRRSVSKTSLPYALAAAAVLVFLLVFVPDQNLGTPDRPQFVVVTLPAGSLQSVVAQENLFDLLERVKEG